MITKKELVRAGRINKPHGIKGEMSVTLDARTRLPEPRQGLCVVLDADGILTPFFIATARRRGTESWLIKLDGIDDEQAARRYALHDLWMLTRDIPELEDDDDDDDDGQLWLDDLVGFTIVNDANNSIVGIIDDYDDTTANILLLVTPPDGGNTIMIPAADDYITAVDPSAHTINMTLPDGLV